MKNSNWQVVEANWKDEMQLLHFYEKVGCESDLLSFGAEGNGSLVQSVLSNQDKSLTRIFMAKENNTILGVLSLVAMEKPRFQHLAQLSCAIGKEAYRKGVASALMQHCLQYVKVSGQIEIIELEVLTHNESALNLYKKFGFEVYATFVSRMKLNDTYYDSYFMRKTI